MRLSEMGICHSTALQGWVNLLRTCYQESEYLKNLFFDFEHMPGNYSVQRPVGIETTGHGLQRRKRRVLITFLGTRRSTWYGAAKRGLNDAKVVAFGASKVYLRKKLQNWRPVAVYLPPSHYTPSVSSSLSLWFMPLRLAVPELLGATVATLFLSLSHS